MKTNKIKGEKKWIPGDFWKTFESRLPCATSGTKARINDWLESRLVQPDQAISEKLNY